MSVKPWLHGPTARCAERGHDDDDETWRRRLQGTREWHVNCWTISHAGVDLTDRWDARTGETIISVSLCTWCARTTTTTTTTCWQRTSFVVHHCNELCQQQRQQQHRRTKRNNKHGRWSLWDHVPIYGHVHVTNWRYTSEKTFSPLEQKYFSVDWKLL